MDGTAVEDFGDGLFVGAGGIKFYYQYHRHEAPRAVLVIVRGSGAYRDLFAHLIADLAHRGYCAYGFDHREHTRVPGQTGYLNEWSHSQDDVLVFVQMVLEQERSAPLFLLGTGVGGSLALSTALHHPDGIAGVAAFDPAPLEEEEVAPLLTRVGRTLAGLFPVPSVPSSVQSMDVEGQSSSTPVDSAFTLGDATVVEEAVRGSGELPLPHLIFRPGGTGEGTAPAVDYRKTLQELETWIAQIPSSPVTRPEPPSAPSDIQGPPSPHPQSPDPTI